MRKTEKIKTLYLAVFNTIENHNTQEQINEILTKIDNEITNIDLITWRDFYMYALGRATQLNIKKYQTEHQHLINEIYLNQEA